MVCTPKRQNIINRKIDYHKMKEKYCTKNGTIKLNLKEALKTNDMSASDLRRRQTEAEKNVNRLRNCMPEKLMTFCKMHLSFLLELDGSKLEEMFLDSPISDAVNKKKTATPFSTKKKEKPSPIVQEALSKDHVGHMYKLISFLVKSDNLKTEGLFRKTGNVSRQRLLKDWIKDGVDFTLNSTFSPHDVATVLKQLLSDLHDPLLTEKHCEAYMQIIDMVKQVQSEKDRQRGTQKQLKALQLMILLLPRENAVLLECLLDLLHRAANTPENKMSASSLGVVFAPSLLCPRKLSAEEMQTVSSKLSKVITVMIENAPSLFCVPKELGDDVAYFWKEMEDPNMTVFVEDKENFNDKANIQKAKYGSSSAVNTVLTFTTRKSPEEVDSTQDTQVALAQLYAHVQSMPESARKKKLLKQFNRASAIHPTGSSSTKKGKHIRSRSFGESLKKHFPILAKQKQHDLTEGSGHLTCGIARPAWFDDSMTSISYAKTPDNTCRPIIKTNSSAVHVVDLGASPCNVKPRKRLSDENLNSNPEITAAKYAIVDRDCEFVKRGTPCKKLFPSTPGVQRPVAKVSPITKSVKKLPESSKKELMTPGSRLPMMMIKSPNGSFLETVL